MLVVDASVAVALLVDAGPDGRWAAEVTADVPLVAPDHVLVESAAILRRATLAGQLPVALAAAAHRDLLDLGVTLVGYEVVAERVWQLRGALPTRDAAYVALAELLAVPLVTLDGRLAGAFDVGCEVRTPEPSLRARAVGPLV